MDKQQLMPCPFCGGAAGIQDQYRYSITVRCVDAECRGHTLNRALDHECAGDRTVDEAVFFWNRRAPQPPSASGERDYPPLPQVGPITYAMAADVEQYKIPRVGNHLVGVFDVALWSTDQMHAYVDADRQARASLAPSPGVDVELLVTMIQAELDHAACNDTRLAPVFGRVIGDPAVRAAHIEAAIEGWRKECENL